jgi:hypothetical protein
VGVKVVKRPRSGAAGVTGWRSMAVNHSRFEKVNRIKGCISKVIEK